MNCVRKRTQSWSLHRNLPKQETKQKTQVKTLNFVFSERINALFVITLTKLDH